MSISLAGKRILVTGASSGIGRATALAAAADGAEVLLVARREAELKRLWREINDVDGAGEAHVYPCDLYDTAGVDSLVDLVLREHGGVDVLVNNAGHSIRRSVRHSVDRLHDYERTMRLNYLAPVQLTLGLLTAMREQRFGHVVNVTTQGIQVHTPRFTAYLASKAALEEFGRTAGRELASDNVTFSSVRMPLVRTPMIAPTEEVYRGMPSLSAEQAARLVLRAARSRNEIVNATGGAVFELADLAVPNTMRRLVHRFGYLPRPSLRPRRRRS
ncbi:short-subunit dehydrogenase [Herbihabitans rhizosphaerae]|uniref:Short-subunit dehydrogenase n=1 Tax=Herbihabitans rhizosphaerae TaxID=1872711 RepID=A0A4Q7KJM9_9PSEU|nr:SDR family NAD(P)-dependent oxidoreductase [Herbihabitans rhizosphaerae]RZS36394.1 short-subunit dehydrogenase [Herbihabitans rhizosphaerae]